MYKTHVESCPGCHEFSLDVEETTTKDVGYCQACTHEMVRPLLVPRKVQHPEVSVRDRSGGKDDDRPRGKPPKRR